MRLDYLIDQMLGSIAREWVLLRRITRYVLPLLLLPIGFALAQMASSWAGLVIGGLFAMVLLVQIEFFLRPSLVRGRMSVRDVRYYLNLESSNEAPSLSSTVPLLVPGTLALVISMALFLPTIMAHAAPWQRLVALALGIGVIWSIWQRLAAVVVLLGGLEARLVHSRSNLSPSPAPLSISTSAMSRNDLLDPAISTRVARLPLPPLLLSPAALALLRIEAYLMMRDAPERSEQDILAALQELAQEIQQDEIQHGLLPPVGGKIYFPVAAGGVLATMLGATARCFGMDGGFSASLGTWLMRLPPARSYRVAGRLLDAVIALRVLPHGAIVPHHLTIQGDLGYQSCVLSVLYLASSPLLLEERANHAQADERPFIMRGGGVLDDLYGRGRYKGARTDFVDGFLISNAPELDGVEHLTTHTINLRIKQVLAYGLQSVALPYDRRSAVEQSAASAYLRFRKDLHVFLAEYDLSGALEVDWLDGRWSDVWPFIQRMNLAKEREPDFLDRGQALRDRILDELEQLAIAASRTHPL